MLNENGGSFAIPQNPNLNQGSGVNQAGMMEAKKIRQLKGVLQRDEAGKIIYPIIINSSLSILDLGEVEYERPNYHSEKNLFPIGFKSLREHNS